MKKSRLMTAILAINGITLLVMAGAMGIDDIPDRKMVSKGGVLYPYTGDSGQDRFQTPMNARELFPPGTLVGVLPEDCVSASSGEIGSFYRCDHNFALKEENLNGRTVYRVIEAR